MPKHTQRSGALLTSLLLAASILPLVVSPQTPSSAAPLAPIPAQIEQHEQNLAQARTSQDQKAQTTELNTLASLYRQSGARQKAVDYCNLALSLERNSHDRGGEALSLTTLGRIDTDLGQEQKALDLLNQSLPIWREIGNRRGEALALTDIGRVYNNLGRREDALKYLNQSLPIMEDAKSVLGQADALDNIGTAYSYMGRGAEALDYFGRALTFWREAGERGGEALTLGNMAIVYDNLGEKEKSLEFYQSAVELWREVGNRPGEARALNFQGRLYSDLGQQQKALDLYNQALPIWREVANPAGEGLALNDIGRAYADLGQNQRALDYYTQALTYWRQAGNRRGEALSLTNSARAWSALAQKNKALTLDWQSLMIWREVEDNRGQAFALLSIGGVYSDERQYQRALPMKLAALSLVKTAGDPDLQGAIDTSLMRDFRSQRQLDEAIFFGTEAVNSFQQERSNITGLDQDLQVGFVLSRSQTYRELAELLVQADRLAEADRVLDLVKQQELKEVVRGASQDPSEKTAPLPLTAAQQTAASELDKPQQAAVAMTTASAEYASLIAKSNRTAEENERLKALDSQIASANEEVAAFFKSTLYPQLAQKTNATDANALVSKERSDVSQLQNTLAALGPRVIGIRLLFADDHVYEIVVTQRARKKIELKATPSEIRQKVWEVCTNLRSPTSNAKPHLNELYTMVVAPLEPELKALEAEPSKGASNSAAPVILWSLDGALRYVPMAALYDGTRYMAERFDNVLVTSDSYGHMTASVNSAQPHVLAMGLSKSYGGLPALPGVIPELDGVVHDPDTPSSHGPMDGRLFPNEEFTFSTLQSQLAAPGSFSVIHIASHFVADADNAQEPYLMLAGNDTAGAAGFELTLSKLEDSPLTFDGTHLLTLSACSTARQTVASDGLEMDSLGMVAQEKGAEAVIATLWDVNDASTSRLMDDFYSLWTRSPEAGKAEALRKAQLVLLQTQDYSHPFYWAPFVLTGNFR